MATLQQLLNQKSFIDKIKDFVTTKTFFVAMIIVLGTLSVHFYKVIYLSVEFWSWIAVSVYFLLGLWARYQYSQSGSLMNRKSFMKDHQLERILFYFLIIAEIYIFAHSSLGRTQIIWLVCIVVVTIFAVLLYRTYPKEYEPIRKIFSDVKTVGLITALIAACQLLIAFPQLKFASKSATGDDISNALAVFQHHVESFNFVSIPDSLQNDEVKRAQLYQRQLYAYSLYISETKNPMETNDLTNNRVLFELDKAKSLAKNSKVATDLISCANIMQQINTDVNNKQQCDIAIVNCFYLIKDISQFYTHSEDSILLAACVDNRDLDMMIINLGTINHKQGVLLTTIKNATMVIKDPNILNKPMLVKTLKKDLEKAKKLSFDTFYSDEHKAIISGTDKLCTNLITFLNLVQLKYAYQVDYLENKNK